MGKGMQRLIRIGLSPQEYSELLPHQVMSAPLECGICGWVGRLQRHGKYWRWLQSALKLLKIAVARFLCPECGGTTSLLPDFALSYRLMEIELVDLYFRAESKQRGDFAFGLPVPSTADRRFTARLSAPLGEGVAGSSEESGLLFRPASHSRSMRRLERAGSSESRAGGRHRGCEPRFG